MNVTRLIVADVCCAQFVSLHNLQNAMRDLGKVRLGFGFGSGTGSRSELGLGSDLGQTFANVRAHFCILIEFTFTQKSVDYCM